MCVKERAAAKEKIAGLQRYKHLPGCCSLLQMVDLDVKLDKAAYACRENAFLLEEREILFRQLESRQLH